MNYGYIRVSTDKQNTQNQEFEIKKFAQNNNIIIHRMIREKISSAVGLEKRRLGKLLKTLKKGDVLITAELSRLGRNLLQIMSILHFCLNREIQIWTIKDNYRLGLDIQSKVLAFAFGLSAEIERNLISLRTKEALTRLKAEGKKLGRPRGSKNKSRKLDIFQNKIKNLLQQEVPLVQIARILKCNRKTIRKYISENIQFPESRHPQKTA